MKRMPWLRTVSAIVLDAYWYAREMAVCCLAGTEYVERPYVIGQEQ